MIINKRKKRITTFILGIALSTAIVSTCFAVSKTLSLYFERQQQTNWCWAATSQSIIDKIAGRRPTQSQIVTNIFGSAVNKSATAAQSTQSLAAWGVGSTYTGGKISYSAVKTDIDNGKPIKAGILWKAGGGHMLVVYGYYNNSTNTDPQLYYLDPWPSNPLYSAVKYDYFVSNSTYSWVLTNYKCYKTY